MYTAAQINSRIESSHGCAMGGIIAFSCCIDNALCIAHGPTGCAGGYRMIFLLADRCPILPTTAIYQYEVAMGTKEKLQAALYKAKRVYDPSVIFVTLTCATSMIQEDYNDIIEQFEADTGTKVFLEDGSSLFGEDNDGYRKTYDDFVKWLDVTHAPDGKSIALDGMAPSIYNARKNMEQMKKIVESCGLTLAPSLSTEFNIEKDKAAYSTAAVLNIGLLNRRDDTFAPIGFDYTRAFMEKICQKVNVPIPEHSLEEITAAGKMLADDIAYLKTKLNGRYVMIEADEFYAVPLAKTMHDLFGCKIACSSDAFGVETLEEMNFCDWVEADVGGYELNEFAKELQCAVTFGSSNIYNHSGESLYIPFTAPVWDEVPDNESLFGLDGMKYLIRKLREYFHE